MQLGPWLPLQPMPVPNVEGAYVHEHRGRHANLPKDGPQVLVV